MTDPKQQSKIAKKAGKAAAKAIKKSGRTGEAPGSAPQESALQELAAASSAHKGGQVRSLGPSPAERSAAAAERQVRYTRVRMWIGILTLIATIITVLLTVDPFGWR